MAKGGERPVAAGEAFDVPRAALLIAWVATPLPLSLRDPPVARAVCNGLVCGLVAVISVLCGGRKLYWGGGCLLVAFTVLFVQLALALPFPFTSATKQQAHGANFDLLQPICLPAMRQREKLCKVFLSCPPVGCAP